MNGDHSLAQTVNTQLCIQLSVLCVSENWDFVMRHWFQCCFKWLHAQKPCALSSVNGYSVLFYPSYVSFGVYRLVLVYKPLRWISLSIEIFYLIRFSVSVQFLIFSSFFHYLWSNSWFLSYLSFLILHFAAQISYHQELCFLSNVMKNNAITHFTIDWSRLFYSIQFIFFYLSLWKTFLFCYFLQPNWLFCPCFFFFVRKSVHFLSLFELAHTLNTQISLQLSKNN